MKKLFFISLLLLVSYQLNGCQTINETKNLSYQNKKTLSEMAKQHDGIKDNLVDINQKLNELRSFHTDELLLCQTNINKLSTQNNELIKNNKNLATTLNKYKHANKPKAVVETVKDNTKLDDGKLIFGEAEWIYIVEANTTFDSRIDTGASLSSINAHNIEAFEREGDKWYRFDIPLEGNKEIKMEAPWVRDVSIRQASSDGELDERPVVRLTVKIGNLTETAEFSLRNRSKMQYTLLIGREFIKDLAVVDVSRKHVQEKITDANLVGALKFSKKKGMFIQNSRTIELKKLEEKNIPATPKETTTKENNNKVVDVKAKKD